MSAPAATGAGDPPAPRAMPAPGATTPTSTSSHLRAAAGALRATGSRGAPLLALTGAAFRTTLADLLDGEATLTEDLAPVSAFSTATLTQDEPVPGGRTEPQPPSTPSPVEQLAALILQAGVGTVTDPGDLRPGAAQPEPPIGFGLARS